MSRGISSTSTGHGLVVMKAHLLPLLIPYPSQVLHDVGPKQVEDEHCSEGRQACWGLHPEEVVAYALEHVGLSSDYVAGCDCPGVCDGVVVALGLDVYPYLGSDGMYIKIGLTTASTGITLDLTIEDSSNPIDISGYTFFYKTDGSWTEISTPSYDSDLGAVTLPMTGTSFSTIKLRISDTDSDIYLDAETLIIYETAWS